MKQGLSRVRVLDFSTQVAGPYTTKLLADGGADVIKVEPQCGDPLRRWSATGAELGEEDSGLFRYLNAGKRAIVGSASDDRVRELLGAADLVVEAWGLAWDAGERLDIDALRTRHPRLVILSITPWGRTGPWSDLPASEFTIQAESGSIGMRGLPGREPFQAGGRIGEWLAGTFASVAALAAVRDARKTGQGEHVDFSMLELAYIAASNYSDLTFRLIDWRRRGCRAGKAGDGDQGQAGRGQAKTSHGQAPRRHPIGQAPGRRREHGLQHRLDGQ